MASPYRPSTTRYARTTLSQLSTRPCTLARLTTPSTSPAHTRPHIHAHPRSFHSTPSHGARLIRRPKIPYTFTQLIQLSDGSYMTTRTTSPAPLYKSTRDVRNAPLWNPSDKSLVGVEKDEAGRLREFRRRFGRSWDLEAPAASSASASVPATALTPTASSASVSAVSEDGASAVKSAKREVAKDAPKVQGKEQEKSGDSEENLLDLISAYGKNMDEGVTRAMQSGTVSKKVKKK